MASCFGGGVSGVALLFAMDGMHRQMKTDRQDSHTRTAGTGAVATIAQHSPRGMRG
jgi:hypothetical protein